jgi:hypothetical protein
MAPRPAPGVTDARDVIIFVDDFGGCQCSAAGEALMGIEEGDVEEGSRKGPVRKKAVKSEPRPKAQRTKVAASAPVNREARIRMAAYLRAERRGFVPGGELDDWIAAELEISEQDSAPAAATPKPRTRRTTTRKAQPR